MANKRHLARLKQGVEAWNQWIKVRKSDTRIDLRNADLAGVDLHGAILYGAQLAGAELTDANLLMANLAYTDLTGAHLPGANLAWTDLIMVHFAGADLTRANLGCANIIESGFTREDLIRSGLTGANLTGADLSRANLINVHLPGANLTGTNLEWTHFSGVDLTGADLTGATMGLTEFARVDLATVLGLDTIQHKGPSTIGIDTLYDSKGNIPEVFLRGVGVPDEMITYMKSLVGRPFEFYSCFISYSSKDQDFAERLHADLQDKGVRCWFAPHDIQGGRKIHEQIDQAIRVHERLLLILSTDSMNSEWVKAEIAKARQREAREKRQVLFPMRLGSFEAVRDWECFDADTGKDSAREIREYFIPDFSNWKNHDAYQVAFRRLLRDLKAEI